MPHPTKIATCCYCGTRAALVLSDSGRHELSCASCGAPLHDLKMIRKPSKAARAENRKTQVPYATKAKPKPQKPPKPSKRKKPRKSALKWFLEEAKDALEDIFD